jgi:hypothetical protein
MLFFFSNTSVLPLLSENEAVEDGMDCHHHDTHTIFPDGVFIQAVSGWVGGIGSFASERVWRMDTGRWPVELFLNGGAIHPISWLDFLAALNLVKGANAASQSSWIWAPQKRKRYIFSLPDLSGFAHVFHLQ